MAVVDFGKIIPYFWQKQWGEKFDLSAQEIQGWYPLPDQIGYFGTPGGHFLFCLGCGVVGGEQVPERLFAGSCIIALS